MHRHSPLLGVDPSTEHRRRAEEDTYPAAVHVFKEAFPCPLRGGALDKLDFISRDAEAYQLLLDVGIDVPLVRLVSGKVTEDKLRTLIGRRAYIIVIDGSGADGSLVTCIIAELLTQKAHVESHLACHIGSNEHLCLVEVVRLDRVKPEVFPVSTTGKGNEASDHFFLLDCRRMREEADIFLRHIKMYHVGCTVVGDFTQEHRQFRHFDISAETLLALDCPCHVQLIVGCLFGKYGRPGIETANLLTLEFTWAQILEHHIKLCQRIYHHRTGQKSRPKVTACSVLDVTDGKQQVHCPLRAFCIADTCYPVVACLEHEVLEHVAFIDKDVVYTH